MVFEGAHAVCAGRAARPFFLHVTYSTIPPRGLIASAPNMD
jgi:hypothetical protein